MDLPLLHVAPYPQPSRRRTWPLRRAFAVAIVVSLLAPGVALAWDAGTFSGGDESLLVTLTNQARASAGLSALAVDSTLVSLARSRSQDMEDRGYFSHTTPEGTTVFDAMHAAGYCYVGAGENIGRNNYPDDSATAAVFDGFMGSSSHRDNILGNWDHIGVGAYKGADGFHVWTMLFAQKCSSGGGSGGSGGTTTKPAAKPAPKAAPKATPSPTPMPTPTPTPLPTPNPTPLAIRVGRVEPDPSGVPPSRPRFDGSERSPDGAGGLQIVDPVAGQSLVETIVGSVTWAYFGG